MRTRELLFFCSLGIGPITILQLWDVDNRTAAGSDSYGIGRRIFSRVFYGRFDEKVRIVPFGLHWLSKSSSVSCVDVFVGIVELRRNVNLNREIRERLYVSPNEGR